MENICNFKCIYCRAKKFLENKTFNISLMDTIRKFEQFSGGDHRYIMLASGEISISPDRDKILGIIERNHWNVHIFTNASVFSQKIADLIHLGSAMIQVSMDAGTAETFAKIKGVDCYGKVVSILQKYSNIAQSASQIVLKYIILPGVNDNEADIDGFVELAGQLKADVVISSDNHETDESLPETTVNYAVRLGKMCQERKIRFIFASENFNLVTYKKLCSALFN